MKRVCDAFDFQINAHFIYLYFFSTYASESLSIASCDSQHTPALSHWSIFSVFNSFPFSTSSSSSCFSHFVKRTARISNLRKVVCRPIQRDFPETLPDQYAHEPIHKKEEEEEEEEKQQTQRDEAKFMCDFFFFSSFLFGVIQLAKLVGRTNEKVFKCLYAY